MFLYTLEGLKTHAALIHDLLEKRRTYYRWLAYICLTLGISIGVAGVRYTIPALIELTLRGYTAVTSEPDLIPPPISSLTLMVLVVGGLVALAIGCWIILWPIFSYRGNHRMPSGIFAFYTLKDGVYSHLLKYYGLEFTPASGVRFADTRKLVSIPSNDLHMTEDHIHGIIENTHLSASEIRCAIVKDRKRYNIFRGFALLLDTCEVESRLRAAFQGRTLIIAAPALEKAKDWLHARGIHAQDHQLCAQDGYYIYSEAPEQAEKLWNPELHASLEALNACLTRSHAQKEHVDSKLYHGLHQWSYHMVGKVMKLLSLLFLFGLYTRDFSYAQQDMDLTKDDPDARDGFQSPPRYLSLECYEDKLLILIPHAHDLFETDSVFTPAFHQEDLELLHLIMQLSIHAARSADKALSSPAA